jgi:hypothetical protein
VDELRGAKSFAVLVESLHHLFEAMSACGYFVDPSRHGLSVTVGARFVDRITQAIDLSPAVDLRLEHNGASIDLLPAGVPLLDDTVDSATQWLGRYPDVEKEFRQALTILAARKHEQYRQAQDSLRFAFEKLLKLVLQNSTRLEDQGRPLKDWLTAKGVHENLREAAVQIVGVLTKKYQNAAVKHDNAVDDGILKVWANYEVEYMVYQYATLIRLISAANEAQTA